MNSHLCGLNTKLSARSSPASSPRNSGHTAADPAMAPSTCSHMPAASATGAIAGTGSTASELVVPMVAITRHGTRPAARSSSTAAASRSGRRAKASSTSISRTWSARSPATRAPFSSDEWACVEA